MNLSWLAEVIFFGSYFIAWASHQLARAPWVNVSAWAALVVAISLVLFNGYPLLQHRAGQPQA